MDSKASGQDGDETAVSVVVPAYNEGAHIGAQLKNLRAALDATGWRYEIIVVDDGSTDATASESKTDGSHVLQHAVNRGYGAALKTGIRTALYPWILITDADGTYPTAAIPGLLTAAASADMVVGARVGVNAHIPWMRRPAKRFLNWLASYLAGKSIPDLNSGMRLMRRSLVQRYEYLLPEGFSFTTSITLAMASDNHDIVYIPIDYHRRLGTSKIRPTHALEFTILVLRMIVFFNPLKVFLPLGAILAALGVVKLAYDLTQGNFSDSVVLSISAALIIWAVGLLADQNARIARRQ